MCQKVIKLYTMLASRTMDNEVNEGACIFILESVVYFVDPKSPGSLGFLGGKERIRIPITNAHSSLQAFRRHIIEHARLKAEAEKRGLGSSIDLKLCRLVKTPEGSKAYSINTQAQWDVERPLFANSAVLQGGHIVLYYCKVCVLHVVQCVILQITRHTYR